MKKLIKVNDTSESDYCLIFRIQEKECFERNNLVFLLIDNGFEWTESTGCRASFEDNLKNNSTPYESFKNICFSYAKKHKTNIETFRMIDPGLGLMYELYFDSKYHLSKGYPILKTFKLPKEVSNYDFYEYN